MSKIVQGQTVTVTNPKPYNSKHLGRTGTAFLVHDVVVHNVYACTNVVVIFGDFDVSDLKDADIYTYEISELS